MDDSERVKELITENERLLKQRADAEEAFDDYRSIVAAEKAEESFKLQNELDGLKSLMTIKENDIRNLKSEHNQKVASLRRELTAANNRRGHSQNMWNRNGNTFTRTGDGRRSMPKPAIDLTELNDEPSHQQQQKQQQKQQAVNPTSNPISKNAAQQQQQKQQQQHHQQQQQHEKEAKRQSESSGDRASSSQSDSKLEAAPAIGNENKVNGVMENTPSPLEFSLFMSILTSIQRIGTRLSRLNEGQGKEFKRQIPTAGAKTGIDKYQQICHAMFDWHTKAVRILSSGTSVSLNPMVDMVFELLLEAKRASSSAHHPLLLSTINTASVSIARDQYHLDIFAEALDLLAVVVDLYNPYLSDHAASGLSPPSRRNSIGDVTKSGGSSKAGGGGVGTKRSKADMEDFLGLFESSRNQITSEDGASYGAASTDGRDLRSNFAVAAAASEGSKGLLARSSGGSNSAGLSQASKSLQFPGLGLPSQGSIGSGSGGEGEGAPGRGMARRSMVHFTMTQHALEELTRLLSDSCSKSDRVFRSLTSSEMAGGGDGPLLGLSAQRALCRLFWASQVEAETGKAAADSSDSLNAFYGTSLVPLLTKSLRWGDPFLLAGHGEGLTTRKEVVEVLTTIFAANGVSMTSFLDSHHSKEAISEALLAPLIAQFRLFPHPTDVDKTNLQKFEGSLATYQALVAMLLRVLFVAAEREFVDALTVPHQACPEVQGDGGSSLTFSGGRAGSGGVAVSDEESNLGGDDRSERRVDYSALSALSLAWSRGLRALDGAAPLLSQSGASFGHSALVGQLTKLLNAFAVRVQASSETSNIADFGRELVERVGSTLVRWDTRHHHQALLAYGDDLLELRELLETYY